MKTVTALLLAVATLLFAASCSSTQAEAATARKRAEAASSSETDTRVAGDAAGAEAAPSAADAPSTTIKLLTWNVQLLPTALSRYLKSLQRGQSERAPLIVQYLNEQDYDVIVLQEVIDKGLTEFVKEGLKARYPHLVAPAPGKGVAGASGGNLIAARVPIRYVAHIIFENVAGVDRIATKGCLLVEGEKDGVVFQVAGTHLQAGRQDKKDKQYVELGEKIAGPHRREGVPQIFAGDFNTDEGTDKFEVLLAQLGARAFPMTDPRPYTIDPENTWSRPGKRPGRPDHVLLNPCGTASKIVRQTVQRARSQVDGKPMDLSDHYGLIAEICLTNRIEQ